MGFEAWGTKGVLCFHHPHERPSLADDRPVRTTDPTGTAKLRKRLNRELDKRWRTAARLMREAVAVSNILGVGAEPGLATVSLTSTGSGGVTGHPHPPLPGSDKIEGFHQFVTRVLQAFVLGGNAAWISPYLAEAGRIAAERSGRLGVRSSQVTPPAAGPALAASELGAIVARTATEATRAVAHEMGRRFPQAAAISRAVDKVIKAGAGKSKLAADYLVSKAFTYATIQQFRAAGISKVGVEPERYAKRVRGKTVLMTRDKKPVAEEDVVEVVTAGDDRVCPECDEIAASGPYDIEEAMDLLPVHPNCRCGLVASEDAGFGLGEGEFGAEALGLGGDVPLAALGLGGAVPQVPGLGLGMAPEMAEEAGLVGLEPTEEEAEAEDPEAALETAAEEEHGLSGVGKAAMGAALGLGAGALLGTLLPGEEEKEEPEAVVPEEPEAEEEPEDDFPEIFSGTTADEYIAYVKRWLEWADANDWPSNLIQEKWDEESAIRRALQVPLTPEQANDLLAKMESAGAD